MSGFDVFLPWIGLAIVLYFLYQVQRFIQRHLFGVGYLIARDRGPATLLFYLTLLPGVILHELSRYIVAGMFRIVPTHFTLFPEEQQDGTFEVGFIHFGFIINPVYRAILDLVPLAVGIGATIIIGHFALGWTDFIGKLATLDFYVIGEAFQKLVNKPDFVLWSYILFGITNTMLPSRKEARALWLPIAILVAILSIFVVLGIWMAVYRLMMGPVASIIYGLTTVFGLVLFIDVIAGVGLFVIEKLVSAITRRDVQYGPPEAKLTKAAKAPLKSVFELQLPLPAPPGKPGFKVRSPVTTLPVPVGETRPATIPEKEPVTVERPSRPAIGAPSTPKPAPKPALGSGGYATSGDEMTEPLPDEAPATPKGLPVPKPPPLSGGTPAPKPAALSPAAKPAKDEEADEALAPAKPATPALGTPRPASPFGANKPPSSPLPARPAATTSAASSDKDADDAPAKPATPSPLGAPKPASPFGAGANKPPSSPLPARPAASIGSDKDADDASAKPASPSPLGAPKPASPFGAGANKPPSSPFPARPAATTSAASSDKDADDASAKPATPSPLGAPKPASPFGVGANKPPSSPFPARPAATTGDKPSSPFAPKPPDAGRATGNLPALRPNQQPTPTGSKSPVPVSGRPSPLSAPKSSPSDDDVIEGEVVDDDELKYEPPED